MFLLLGGAGEVNFTGCVFKIYLIRENKRNPQRQQLCRAKHAGVATTKLSAQWRETPFSGVILPFKQKFNKSVKIEEMKMLIKDINVKSLNTGDKSARITLETTSPDQIEELKKLVSLIFVEVTFKNGGAND